MKREDGLDATRSRHGAGITAICGRIFFVGAALSVPAACDNGEFCAETRSCAPSGNTDARDAKADVAPATGSGGESSNGAGGNAPGAGGAAGAAQGAGGSTGAGGQNTNTVPDSGPGGAFPDGSSGPGVGDAGTSVDAGSGGAVTDGSSTDGDSAPSACDPAKSPRVAPCSIDEQYGVFVSPNGSDATGDGSRLRPVGTLTKAVALAHSSAKRVFACATQGPFKEAVTIDASVDGVAAYGRFDCSTWTYSSATSASVVSPVAVALTIRSLVRGVHLEDFSFQAANGVVASDSSIAALIVQSQNVTLKGVTLTAGSGVNGVNGTGVTMPAEAGFDGRAGGDGCGDSAGAGFDSSQTLCGGVASGSRGGRGGQGYDERFPPGQGLRGTPGLLSGGAGGVPETATSACQNGQLGTPGTTQPPAKGGASGSLSAAGYKPNSGGSGLDGGVGQGGGGGGGRLADADPDCEFGGAAGGTGGSGGCGGHGGTGGKGGGASIALASISSSVSLDGCVLVAHSGGAGGRGGPGQPGGDGGLGGQGGFNDLARTDHACAGNAGGTGGDGGTGGGGAGGPSVGVASVGTAPSQINTTIQVATSPAPGGADGTGATTGAGAGTPGLVANAHDF